MSPVVIALIVVGSCVVVLGAVYVAIRIVCPRKDLPPKKEKKPSNNVSILGGKAEYMYYPSKQPVTFITVDNLKY